MPSTLEINVGKAETAYKTLNSSLTKLQADVKTYSTNYDNAVSMYWASLDQIKDLEKKVQGGKDPKAPAELQKWKTNQPQLAAKVKPLYQQVVKLKEGTAQAKKSAEVVQKTVEGLNKDAARAAMDDVKKTASTLKDITAGAKMALTVSTKLYTTMDQLPKCPPV